MAGDRTQGTVLRNIQATQASLVGLGFNLITRLRFNRTSAGQWGREGASMMDNCLHGFYPNPQGSAIGVQEP